MEDNLSDKYEESKRIQLLLDGLFFNKMGLSCDVVYLPSIFQHIVVINIDLSKIIFIFSYNDASKINPILLDRMFKIKTKGFNISDKIKIQDSKNFGGEIGGCAASDFYDRNLK